MSLGTNISRLRAEHHLSQGDLAEALAVSRQSVSKWETDSSVPDLDKLVKLSQVFDVTLDEMVMGAEPQPKAETPPQQVVVSHRMPGRKIAGILLFCMAFLTFLVLTALGGLLEGLMGARQHPGEGNWRCFWLGVGPELPPKNHLYLFRSGRRDGAGCAPRITLDGGGGCSWELLRHCRRCTRRHRRR